MQDEDQLLTASEVADLLTKLRGKTVGRATWTGYVSRGQPASDPAPKPDGRNTIIVRGIASPRWRKSVVVAWNERVTRKNE